ncbi:MAG: 4Fe-4S binding protein [Negativicutes bacterium]|nr:4Fe-4S binding protein [Negativicutes bacterium]
MGHILADDRSYHLLQQRLDRNITGAPYSPVFIKILQMLFSAEEADFARQIPLRPTLMSELARKLGMEEARLAEMVSSMAKRGLVFDAEYNGRRYVVLAPVVIGFFEFTFMRARNDLPLAELASLFEEYMLQDDRFAHSVFDGSTQIGRALTREENLPGDMYNEILDYERASRIIEEASLAAVSLCACRHKASHLGKACHHEQRTCLTFNQGAAILVRNGLAEQIDKREALTIVEQSKEAGLAQIADNVRHGVGYICNCCGCCCGMFQAIKTFNIRNAVVTSNWLMTVDPNKCRGCGACLKACPIDAIGLKDKYAGTESVLSEAYCLTDLCLGCGVCQPACKFGAISMKPRARRVFTPETAFDRYIAMAIERGKLSNLLFDDPTRLSHRALGRIFQAVENSPLVRHMLAQEKIKSVFLHTLVKGAKKLAGKPT